MVVSLRSACLHGQFEARQGHGKTHILTDTYTPIHTSWRDRELERETHTERKTHTDT